jgi:hypothetical protein
LQALTGKFVNVENKPRAVGVPLGGIFEELCGPLKGDPTFWQLLPKTNPTTTRVRPATLSLEYFSQRGLPTILLAYRFYAVVSEEVWSGNLNLRQRSVGLQFV